MCTCYIYCSFHIYDYSKQIINNKGVFFQDEWLVGIMKPIYKNEGDPTLPENYRPITLLSCLGKLFTCILCNRLENYASDIKLIIGFNHRPYYIITISISYSH